MLSDTPRGCAECVSVFLMITALSCQSDRNEMLQPSCMVIKLQTQKCVENFRFRSFI